jgi:hypothetical protein
MRIDDILKNHVRNEEWLTDAASFLVSLEASILAGEAKLPVGLYRSLALLLRGGIRRPK